MLSDFGDWLDRHRRARVKSVNAAAILGSLRPTEAVGNAGEHDLPRETLAWRSAQDPTEDDILGPYYRRCAPYRAKVSPPAASGTILLISGCLWNFQTRCPLRHALIDVWQADKDGHYDNEDLHYPPDRDAFVNRARLQTDASGYYELETIYPGPYKIDSTTWRSPHLHFLVRALGCKTLVTQLFFAGAPYLDLDPFVKSSLVISLTEKSTGSAAFLHGTFDIVLTADLDESG